MNLLNLASAICAILLLMVMSTCNGFIPVDNYLIDCGSISNNSIGRRVFAADTQSSALISTQAAILANSSSSPPSSSDSPLYRTARVFLGPSKYSFPIKSLGRHWIRLYFYPFVYQKYDMSTAVFDVSAQNTSLLTKFSPNSTTFKEFSLKITSSSLEVTFTPIQNSIAYINAIEVVSVPSLLIPDDATTYTAERFNGLSFQAFETMFRVNMGGPLVTPDYDTLSRTWVPDEPFIFQNRVAESVSRIADVKYVNGRATPESAPASVYGTCRRTDLQQYPNTNVNVTWDFHVESGHAYLVRLHFCDIVSSSLNQLYFNLYLDSYLVYPDIDLSRILLNTLAGAIFMDYVTPVVNNSKIRVSIGPVTDGSVYPDAILNGLEIMKMNNSEGSLTGALASTAFTMASSKSKAGIIVGVCISAHVLCAMVLALV